MPFTEKERLRWHAERRNGSTASDQPTPQVCLHCHNPFGIGAGVVTEDAAFCDICLGD